MTISDQDIHFFVNTLKNSSEYDLTGYSEKSLKRRLQKVLIDNRMDVLGILGAIKNKPDFREKILKEITVNTTELFRDPQIWQSLRYRFLPTLKNNQTISIWHAGCSTGQEVYSMLILLSELDLLEKTKIFASDINDDVLEAAREGVYKYRFNIGYLDNFDKVIKENPFNYEEFNDVPYEKYFNIDKTRDIIRIKDFLKEKPIFRKHDLVKDGNVFLAKFDLILCRNVIIYFKFDLQNKVFELFHENLYKSGCLLLGMHETILGPYSTKFEKKGSLYIKNNL